MQTPWNGWAVRWQESGAAGRRGCGRNGGPHSWSVLKHASRPEFARVFQSACMLNHQNWFQIQNQQKKSVWKIILNVVHSVGPTGVPYPIPSFLSFAIIPFVIRLPHWKPFAVTRNQGHHTTHPLILCVPPWKISFGKPIKSAKIANRHQNISFPPTCVTEIGSWFTTTELWSATSGLKEKQEIMPQ